jgi:transposase
MSDIPYPNRGLTRAQRCCILRLLLLGWSPHAIAEDCRISLSAAYFQLNRLLRYGSFGAPALRKLGRPRKLTTADEDEVLELLLRLGWMRQEEIRLWLWCERGVLVHQSPSLDYLREGAGQGRSSGGFLLAGARSCAGCREKRCDDLLQKILSFLMNLYSMR